MSTVHPYPLFVVGSPRSGTSVLVTALRRAAYRGFNEGNFVGMMDEINRIVDQHFAMFGTSDPGVIMSKIDKDEVKAALYEPFKRIVERENPVAPWLDKSGNPAVIRRIPELLALWPSGHFIFAKRRGIENIVSRMRKFPSHPFEYHCQDWAANMSAWRKIRNVIPNLKCLELDQRDMIANPEAVSAQLANFLRLSADQQAQLTTAFREERPQRTSEHSTERLYSLQSTGWSPQEVELFMTHCKQEMDWYGYTLDETYKTQVFTVQSTFSLPGGAATAKP